MLDIYWFMEDGGGEYLEGIEKIRVWICSGWDVFELYERCYEGIYRFEVKKKV